MQSLPGRPLIEVSMEKVKELRELGLTWTKIADILHLSWQTFYRHLDGSNLMGYSELFMKLEKEGICDVNNDIDLFCLHDVFQSHINKCLSKFIYKQLEQPLII